MTRQVVSHYEILEKLGEGGMGVVYRARDLRLSRCVALKFLPPRLLSSEEARRRFVEEARAISALNHPNIAVVYDLCEDADAPCLVMEYLPGGTLRSRIRKLRKAGLLLSLPEIAGYGLQLAGALACAHRKGIIHRDVKSENAMFSEAGTLKVTDFGLAKYLGEAGLSRSGTIAGTAAYMSPEQAQGWGADHRSDVFSLGIVLYELATGELPFKGDSDPALLYEIVHAPMPPVRQLRPDLPEAFERVVLRATAKHPEDRYQKMEELAGDLDPLRGGNPDGPVTETRSDSNVPTIGLKPLSARSRPISPASRHVWISLVVALALALALMSLLGPSGPIAPTGIPSQKQIAVLPFTNIGDDPANEAFCDGLMETLASKLTQLEQFQETLRVVPASEVRKEGVTSARQARMSFGVTLVLSGSVQRSGENVRLTVNLVDAGSLRQLRSTGPIDTRIGDISVLQDGVVSRVAEMLDLELRPDARTALRAGNTTAPAAYDLYLQGLGYLARYDREENLDNAIRLFQQALQNDPDYALAHAGLGEALWRKYDRSRDPKWIDEAWRSCNRAVQLNDMLAHLYVTRGLIQTGTGRYQEAIRDFQKALELDPVNAAAYRNLGDTYHRLDRAGDAEATFRRAIDLRPGDWAGHNQLGVFYWKEGRYSEAEQCFRRVIELTPDNYRGYRNLGGLYSLMKRYDEAIPFLDRSLAIRPTGIAYSNLGTIRFFQGRYAEAARAFEKAVAVDTTDRMLWGNLGDAYLLVPGEESKAAEAHRRAAELARRDLRVNPRDSEARVDLAVYLARLGQNRTALAEIERARQLAPGNVNNLFKSGLVYELTGQRTAAIGALVAAIESGYSVSEVQRHPDLAKLRLDPRFKLPVLAGANGENRGLK